MSRTEKLAKLRNAIRSYRGLKSTTTGKWQQPPNPSAKLAIKKWAEALGRPVEETINKIDSFKLVSEFNAWISSL